MKRLSLVPICAALISTANSQTPPTTVTSLVSIHGGSVSQVVTHRIGIAHDLFRKGFDIEIRGFGGLRLSDHNALTSGIILTPVRPFKIAREVDLTIGPYLAATSGKKFDAGVFVGVTFNFGN
jgi:hypothetical protein